MMAPIIPARIAPMMRTVIVALALAATTLIAASTEYDEIESRRASERRSFNDSEITAGFLKTTFGAELYLTGPANRIRKFDGPVRVFVDNRAGNNRVSEVAS